MTCIDYSKGMLDVFARKIESKNYSVTLHQTDVTEIRLNKRKFYHFTHFPKYYRQIHR